jgi:hypothetical protein
MKQLLLQVGLCCLLLIMSSCKKDNNPATNTPTTITVAGVVKDAAGEPINGVAVIIVGKGTVTSGADGSFSIPNVTTPYDIIMVLSTQKTAIMYKGLTINNPTLVYTSSALGTLKSATISGTVPAAATKRTLVFFVSGTSTFSTTANPTTGAYTINAGWYTSPTTFTGKVYVLRWTPATTGFPTDYDAFGSKDLTISNAGTFTVNFATGELTDPSEQTISGAVSRAATTYSLNSRSLYVNFGNSILFLSNELGTPPFADNFNITVPSIAGATYGIYAVATQPATVGSRTSAFYRANIAPGTSGLALTLAAAPQLTAPVNNGTNVDTTTSFLFSPGGATGIHQVFITGVATNPRFIIYTAASSFTIPNLVSVGLGLPANANYSWLVTQFSPLASVNDAASSAFFSQTSGTGGNVGFGFSESFTFTTKP